jgi:hypothetical protein
MECIELNNLKCKGLKIKLPIFSQSTTRYGVLKPIIFLVLLVATFQKAGATEFELVTGRDKVSIVYGAKAPKLDSISAYLLAGDVERVTGYLPMVGTDISEIKGNVIVIGQAQSSLLKTFNNQANLQHLAGKWESYQIEVIVNPRKGIKKALIIAGSDARGTAYGVFDISARIGVNAWYWWADVIPEKKKTLALNITPFTSAVPSVKYRGIFINDEDWGLQPWAAKTFEPETKDIGPKTYAKVFELLLRLKANLIWPAMHPSTKAFFYYPDNKKVASEYEIVIGSSHAEPMLRNNVGEWDKNTMGSFNYITNSAKVNDYWESRIKESSNNNAIYSLGMRGVHDSGIEGVKSISETVPLLERIIGNQRDMLSKYINKDIKKVPQAFTAYKEVLDIYDHGLKLPDDATIIWPDDNYGYIQRLNNEEEDKRSGGSGVYYHASYWGRPHDYLWLSTTNPGLIQEEMKKAYAMNAKNIWVVNVGDIKPGEYNLQLFMDMAYDIRPFNTPADVKTHLTQWTGSIFGSEKAEKISAVLWDYYQLAFERKPEFMGWSQTEPTTGINFTRYNHQYYGDQAQRRLDAYTGLEKQLQSLKTGIPANRQASFYQLVYYPVVGSSLMNKKFLYHDKAFLYAKQGRRIADYYAGLSAKAYDDIMKETTFYNEGMLNGKWNGMMSMIPRNLPVFKKPDLQLNITAAKTAWTVLPEGYNEQPSTAASLSFDHQSAAKQFIDIFLQQDTALTYKIQSSAPWISISQTSGKLAPSGDKSQQRLWVNIDWTKAPKNKDLSAQLSFSAAGKTVVIPISSKNDKVSLPANGFIEHQGYVSIYAKNYTGITAGKEQHWAELTGMGLTGKSMESLPLKSPSALKAVYTETEIKAQPSLTYDFFSRSSAPAEFKFFTIPTFPLNKNTEMRYAVRIDDGPATLLNFRTIGRSEEWKQNVLSNTAVRSVKLPELKAGKHQVRIYMIDPGVIVDRILIDLGGLQPHYGLIPETRSN